MLPSIIIRLVRELYGEPKLPIPLHAPVFEGNEKKYLLDCVESTFVSSVGEYVNRFEGMMREITGAAYAVACVNGTAGLEIALRLAGVRPGDLVVTQALSFVATANAIYHCDALPAFIDVDTDTLGMSPRALRNFCESACRLDGGILRHKETGRRVAAIVPMHTFGHPCDIEDIVDIAATYEIPVVEDAAEALGSVYNGRYAGTFGTLGVISFNGNKICTSGGGGVILTDVPELATLGKKLTTTAKQSHQWEFRHDMPAWNYRLINIAAALACAQLEQLDHFIADKRLLAEQYESGLAKAGADCQFIREPVNSRSIYWLNAVAVRDRSERDTLLARTNAAGIMTRPVWEPLCDLPMYSGCPVDELVNTRYLNDRIVNLPSSVRKGKAVPHE